MRIEVAGAGAGKTSSMASRILSEQVPEGKVVFCVAFTNAAVHNIESRIIGQNGSVPETVKVSTIHSFLYSELVQPYYHLLFGSRYEKISTIYLPYKPQLRNAIISDLEKEGALHQTMIPKRAKWVVDKKSDDKATTKRMRKRVLSFFGYYCHKIVVDEAQDIDDDMLDVFLALDQAGIKLELFGDPKQDLRGHKCFRKLISTFPDEVSYKCDCHRCPEAHLHLSNRLACEAERQVADAKAREGSINVYFESDVGPDVAKFIENGRYGLAYISKKNARFNTHSEDVCHANDGALNHDLESLIRVKHGNTLTELELRREAFFVANQMKSLIIAGQHAKPVIYKYVNSGVFDFDNKRCSRIAEALSRLSNSQGGGVAVRSIEAIKGLEDTKCLFILTTDLTPYLLGDNKQDNRTKHLLYVALTRSLDELSVLVTKEVEDKYGRERIKKALT